MHCLEILREKFSRKNSKGGTDGNVRSILKETQYDEAQYTFVQGQINREMSTYSLESDIAFL
jgi:hypothetical protein